MINIEKPTIKMLHDNEKASEGRFVIEPLERGYGTTLGNSLRRVLLSTLPGAAVTSIRIDGILHEFSTIPGVTEDVTEIILNIKRLAIRAWSEEPVVATIKASGPCEITAADIDCGSEVKIFNEDHHIATLDKGAELDMELVIDRGRGYSSAEQNKGKDDPISTIAIDSIFSPVEKANFIVSDTRVGQVTDFDKLELEVRTDGSISANDAVAVAARIMQEHLALFVELSEEATEYSIMLEHEDIEQTRVLEKNIEDLELTVRSLNALTQAGIDTVSDLVSMTEGELNSVKNLGKKSLSEIKDKIRELGLSLSNTGEE